MAHDAVDAEHTGRPKALLDSQGVQGYILPVSYELWGSLGGQVEGSR